MLTTPGGKRSPYDAARLRIGPALGLSIANLLVANTAGNLRAGPILPVVGRAYQWLE